MRTSLSTTSHTMAWLLAAGVLAGCATSTQPDYQFSTRSVDGAFVSTDQQLYLFTLGKTLRFDAAPFLRYRALMDSPLKEALACSLMVFHNDRRNAADRERVHGSYGMLLHAAQVTPQQAQAFGLERMEVTAKEATAAKAAAGGWHAQPPRTRYALGLDPACGLPVSGGSYYSAVFESDGQWVQLPHWEALLAQSRWSTPMQARQVVVLAGQKTSDLKMGLEIGGAALGALTLPITLPVMLLLTVPFMGPDDWK